jgi:DNA-binding protein
MLTLDEDPLFVHIMMGKIIIASKHKPVTAEVMAVLEEIVNQQETCKLRNALGDIFNAVEIDTSPIGKKIKAIAERAIAESSHVGTGTKPIEEVKEKE